MIFFDTHAHLNFKTFAQDADEVIKRALNNKVWMINIGVEYQTSKRALDYANKYEHGVWAAVGLHPIHIYQIQAQDEDYDFVTRGEELNIGLYEKLASFEKVVAIGEIGLDYYHLPKDNQIEAKEKQKQVFLAQLTLARRLNLPAIIHCREAHSDMLALLKQFRRDNRELFQGLKKPWGVMHCFTGDEDLAWQYFSLGLLVSFTGFITFSNQWDELLRKLPLDKFMIETDSPFMTPVPHRGKRNEPLYVKYVAQKIAEVKKVSLETIAQATTKNAQILFLS